jgi:hypothetical protein
LNSPGEYQEIFVEDDDGEKSSAAGAAASGQSLCMRRSLREE